MTNSDVQITTKFFIDGSPKNLKVTDTTNYATLGIALADAKGIIKATGPNGVFYNNTNWAAPDITPSVSLISGAISLPLDTNGDVVEGDYEIQYTIRVSGAVTPGDYVNTFDYTYEYVEPTPEITIEYNCLTSQLTSTDETVYTTEVDGTTVSYLTLTRTHTVTPPTGSGLSPTVASTAQVIVGPNIWTKTWITTISTITVWLYPDGLYVQDTITGEDSVEVECSLCLCDILTCINTIRNRYEEYRNNNKPSLAAQKEELLNRIGTEYMLYMIAERCGEEEEKVTHCNNLVDLVSTECTCCDDDDDSATTEIIPISAGVSGTGTGTIWLTGNGTPSSSLGNNGDFYLDLTTLLSGVIAYYFYKKISGSWVLQGYFRGATGSAGAAATSYTTVIENSVTSVSIGATISPVYETLKTLSISGSELLVDNGDMFKIELSCTMTSGVDKWLRIRLTQGITSYDFDWRIAGIYSHLKYELNLTKSTASTETDSVITLMRDYATPSIMGQVDNFVLDTTTAFSINIMVSNITSATAGSITAKNLRVTKFKI